MLTFIKLGGSLITDKREAQHFRADLMRQAAQEIAAARAEQPWLQFLIGHGSGSFGHVAAQTHGTMLGVRTVEQWRGFAEVAYVARRLNALVMDVLHECGLPVIGFQPSATAVADGGKLVKLRTTPIKVALVNGLIPVVYGDVAFDTAQGGTIISTETVFGYLAVRLVPKRIFLLGEVEGVYNSRQAVIPRITPRNFPQIVQSLGGSHGTDVTGGMASKVQGMLTLASKVPGMEIRIFGGTAPGHLRGALIGESAPGTLITAD